MSVKIGRPSSFSAESSKKILDSLRIGMTRRAASASGGVWYTTFLDWLKKGELAKSGAFYDFYHAVAVAEDEAEALHTGILVRAARGRDVTTTKTRRYTDKEGKPVEEVTTTTAFEHSPQFSLEWLKRRKREEWGDSVQFRRMTDDQLIGYVTGVLSNGNGTVGGDAGGIGRDGAAKTDTAGGGEPGASDDDREIFPILPGNAE